MPYTNGCARQTNGLATPVNSLIFNRVNCRTVNLRDVRVLSAKGSGVNAGPGLCRAR